MYERVSVCVDGTLFRYTPKFSASLLVLYVGEKKIIRKFNKHRFQGDSFRFDLTPGKENENFFYSFHALLNTAIF